MTTAAGISYESKTELGEAPCQSCGKLITILLPFVGCVFCSNCMASGTAQGFQSDSEYFKQTYREEE